MIDYDVPEAGSVNLTVFDLPGREVRQNIHEPHAAGSYTAENCTQRISRPASTCTGSI